MVENYRHGITKYTGICIILNVFCECTLCACVHACIIYILLHCILNINWRYYFNTYNKHFYNLYNLCSIGYCSVYSKDHIQIRNSLIILRYCHISPFWQNLQTLERKVKKCGKKNMVSVKTYVSWPHHTMGKWKLKLSSWYVNQISMM